MAKIPDRIPMFGTTFYSHEFVLRLFEGLMKKAETLLKGKEVMHDGNPERPKPENQNPA